MFLDWKNDIAEHKASIEENVQNQYFKKRGREQNRQKLVIICFVSNKLAVNDEKNQYLLRLESSYEYIILKTVLKSCKTAYKGDNLTMFHVKHS